MTGMSRTKAMRTFLMGASLMALTACMDTSNFDGDLRGYGNGIFSTSDAVRSASEARPTPDARGVISYPGYQVVVARQGDTVGTIATRVGLQAGELASYNALPADATLRGGEILALPRRVSDAPAGAVPGAITGGALPPTTTGGKIDVSSIASSAIDRSQATQPAKVAAKPVATAATGAEPSRHKVERGETAYSIARMYNVNVRALADWNGLGNDLAVREGQILMIPVGGGASAATDVVNEPGTPSKAPEPPSAAKPLPAEKPASVAEPVETPPAPDLGATTTAKLTMPVKGKIIRGYQKKKNDGIDLSAAAGTAVAAAADGTVAAITKDTNGVPILVVRHDGNLLTVYANIDAVAVKKGDKIKRGQTIAKVRASSPAFLHFEVRQGFESVDPMPFLQ